MIVLVILLLNAPLHLSSQSRNAQARYSDSLAAAKASDLAWKYRDSQPDSSFYYANKALGYAEKWGLKKLEAYSLSDIGNYYVIQEDYQKASSFLRESLKSRVESGDTNDISSGFNNIALLYNQWQQYDSANYYFSRGLEFAVGEEYLGMRGALLNGMSMTMLHRGRYNEAEPLLKEAIEIAELSGDENALSKRYHNLGKLYQAINRYDLAKDYYQKSGLFYKKIGNRKGSVDITINKGTIQLLQGNYQDAITQFEEARSLSEELELLDNLTAIYNNLGYAYMYIDQLSRAETMLLKGIELAKEKGKNKALVETGLNYGDALDFLPVVDAAISKNDLVQYRPEYYLVLADVYTGTKEFEKANLARVQYDHLRDSLDQIVDQAQLALAEMELTIRDQKILKNKYALQQIEIEKQRAENQTQLLWLWSTVVFALSVILIILLRLRNIKLKAKALQEKKKSEEQLIEVLKKVDIQILEKEIEAKKSASIRIGQDLHDNLASKLAVVQMSLDGVRPKLGDLDAPLVTRLDQIEQLLEDSCEDIRNVAHDLMDKNLRSRGVETELGQFLNLINGVNEMQVNFIPMSLPKNLNENIEKEIVAIVRALIGNVMRHAKASEVTVQIRGEEQALQISIEDNGVGFDTRKVFKNGGMGIVNVQKRIEKLGGEFVLESISGMGTSVMLQIPL